VVDTRCALLLTVSLFLRFFFSPDPALIFLVSFLFRVGHAGEARFLLFSFYTPRPHYAGSMFSSSPRFCPQTPDRLFSGNCKANFFVPSAIPFFEVGPVGPMLSRQDVWLATWDLPFLYPSKVYPLLDWSGLPVRRKASSKLCPHQQMKLLGCVFLFSPLVKVQLFVVTIMAPALSGGPGLWGSTLLFPGPVSQFLGPWYVRSIVTSSISTHRTGWLCSQFDFVNDPPTPRPCFF